MTTNEELKRRWGMGSEDVWEGRRSHSCEKLPRFIEKKDKVHLFFTPQLLGGGGEDEKHAQSQAQKSLGGGRVHRCRA